jgi:hypothetical protein
MSDKQHPRLSTLLRVAGRMAMLSESSAYDMSASSAIRAIPAPTCARKRSSELAEHINWQRDSKERCLVSCIATQRLTTLTQ